MNEYVKQAAEFLHKAHAEMKIEYVGLALNKEWKEKEKRCLYEITLTSPPAVLWSLIFGTVSETPRSKQ